MGPWVAAGLNVARINMSHGSQETHARNIDLVREAARTAGRPVAVLADLAGPKIRVGDLPGPIELVRGDRVVLVPDGIEPGSPDEIQTTYDALAQDLKPGNRVLLDDGLLELEAVGSRDDRVTLTVVRGGTLRSRKGIKPSRSGGPRGFPHSQGRERPRVRPGGRSGVCGALFRASFRRRDTPER